MNAFFRTALILLSGLLALATPSAAQTFRTLRWAALGDAVSNAGWPARTGTRLYADSVISYGHPGGTALRSGDSSYWTSGKLAQVFAYQPDIVSIHLGSADSKAINWDDSASFTNDFRALIDTLSSMPSKPRIVVVFPAPVWLADSLTPDSTSRRNAIIAGSIVPRLRAVALEKDADTVSLYDLLKGRSTLFSGGILPTTAGNDTIGKMVFNAFVDQSIRVMCVGNSITEATSSSVKQKYVTRLNMMLGKRYWTWNGGKSGWWMQRAQLPGASSSYKSYVTDKNLMDSLFQKKPHYITVKLGTNDARQNFWQTPRFVADYQYFIDTIYNTMNPKPKFFLFKAYPAWKVNGNWAFANSGYTADQNGINGDIIRDSLGPAIDVIAASRPTQVAGVVDLYTPFAGPTQSFASDGVHPNAAGQDSMARVIYKTMLPIVTSIRAAASGKSFRNSSAPARRVHLGAGPMPDWMRGAKVLSVDGKAVRLGANGALPAGIYFVKPNSKSTTLGTGKKD